MEGCHRSWEKGVSRSRESFWLLSLKRSTRVRREITTLTPTPCTFQYARNARIINLFLCLGKPWGPKLAPPKCTYPRWGNGSGGGGEAEARPAGRSVSSKSALRGLKLLLEFSIWEKAVLVH